MSSNFYTTKTAALKATKADVRNFNAQEIKLKDKNILDYIKENVPVVKHAQDTRETVTENDLWGQWVETLEDGTIIIHDNDVVNPNGSSSWNTNISKVEDNKAYEKPLISAEKFYANIQTEKIKDGTGMFKGSNIRIFNSDLSSLENGTNMFDTYGNVLFGGLTSFSVELPSLINGSYMFRKCAFDNFTSDLSSLRDGYSMFNECSNLTTFTTDLSSLVNGYGMFKACSKLTSFSSDLSFLSDGTEMFYGCTSLTSFTSDLSSLNNGRSMFDGCTSLSSFTSNLSTLIRGVGMFSGCTNLTSFSSDLSSLINGASMFSGCTNLTSFSSDLSSLSCSVGMFSGCTSLASFTVDLSSLIDNTHGGMFRGCTNLTSFSSDLSSLISGGGVSTGMFYGCTSLSSFTSDLSSLVYGDDMFYGCKLNHHSIMYIIESIKDIYNEKKLYQEGTIPYVTYDSTTKKYSSSKGFMSDGSYVYTYYNPQTTTSKISASRVGTLTIGINVTDDANTINDQLQTFAEGALFDSWADLKQAFVDKGWTVTFQYGGSSTSITYGLRDGERIIPCPVYTKLIEILPQEGEELTDEEKNMAIYCNEDGTKFYEIEWGHDVTNPDDYQQFASLEEAIAYFNVFHKTK